MVKQIATPRRRLAVTLAAVLASALVAAGCGVKGPLVPAPKTAQVPPATTPDTAAAERKP